MLDFAVFQRVIDEVGPSLVRIDFFNYGEAFLHKRAIEMCEYIKSRFPHIYVLHQHPMAWPSPQAQARRLVHSGIDEVTFSIDGATLRRATRNTGNVGDSMSRSPICGPWVDEKRRSGRGPAVPELAVHPFQVERQRRGDESGAGHGRRDRRGSVLLGIHRPSGERLLAPVRASWTGAGSAIRRETWDDSNLGSAIPGATPRARGLSVAAALSRPAADCAVPGVRFACARACRISRRGRSRPTRPMGGGWSGSGRSCAPKTVRSSSSISPAPDSHARSSAGLRRRLPSSCRRSKNRADTPSSSTWSWRGWTGSKVRVTNDAETELWVL